MKDELTILKELADCVFKAQANGSIRNSARPLGEVLTIFRTLGERIKESGNRKEMLFYYDRFAQFFRSWLGGRLGKKPTLNEACCLYDLLYGLKWRSISEPADLTSFNADVLRPFVAFVGASPWPEELGNRRQPSGSHPSRLAYLASWSNLSSANACARVTWTTILGHKALRGDDGSIVVYCIVPPAPDLIEAARKASIELKDFWCRGVYTAAARAILQEAEKDQIDALVIDTPEALATLLIVKRLAPVQIYLELGFDAWRAPDVDFCFQCFSVRWEELTDSPDRCARLPLIDHIDFLAPERDPAEIQELRRIVHSAVPDGNGPEIVYGFFGRMTKVTSSWLQLVERMLQATPRAVCYIGGGGGQSPTVDDFLKRSPVANRIIYQPRYVDGHVVGRVIDVFLDTFPFPGSLACLECQAKGVPVVWMPKGYRDQMAERLEIYRDQSLRASDENDFVRLAVELVEPDRRREASARARALAQKFGNGEENAAQIEQVIQHFAAPVAAAR